MSPNALVYELDLGGHTYQARAVTGEEGLSRSYRFDVSFAIEPLDPLDPEGLVGAAVTLRLVRESDVEREIVGIASRIVRRATRTDLASGGVVEVRVEPSLSRLRHRRDIRVFRDKDAPTIVEEVLRGLGVQTTRKLVGAYPVREYCVQFRESDFDFASRLLEDEGIHYLVRDDGTVVLGDSVTTYDVALGPLPYHAGEALDQRRDAVWRIGYRGSMTAGRVSLRDFNPEKPSLRMDVVATGPTAGGAEWYDYPGEYALPDEGERKAKLRADALACQYERLAGKSFAGRTAPGSTFDLALAPDGIPNGEWVFTRVRHDWTKVGKGYDVSFEALRADRVFRPLVETPVPVEPNPLTGFVTGPAGADIYTDEWGRVKVHFPWDRLQPKDGECSHWIPVLQDNTGSSSSMSRTRWEVVCHFMEGDPDRPVVLGRVYNAEDEFYTPLPENKTRSALRSLSSPRAPGGEKGQNFIQFEDLAGFEQIKMHAQKDQNVVVGNDKTEQIDLTEALSVAGHEKIKIGTEHKVTTKDILSHNVSGNETETIGGNLTQALKKESSESVKKNHSLTVGGMHNRTMGEKDGVSVKGNLTEKVGALVLEGSVKGNTTNVKRAAITLVGGAVIDVAQDNITTSTGKVRVELVGGIHMMKAGEELANKAGTLRTTTVGATMTVEAKKQVMLTGVEKMTINVGAASTWKAPAIHLRVGGTHIAMKEGSLVIEAKSGITLKTRADNNLKSSTSTQN